MELPPPVVTPRNAPPDSGALDVPRSAGQVVARELQVQTACDGQFERVAHAQVERAGADHAAQASGAGSAQRRHGYGLVRAEEGCALGLDGGDGQGGTGQGRRTPGGA